VTEREWLTEGDPIEMVRLIHPTATDRKLRLFAVAWCRRIWQDLPNEFRAAVAVAEQFADRERTKKELNAVKRESGAALTHVTRHPDVQRACTTAWSSTRDAPSAAMYPCWVFTEGADRRAQVALLRDLFGNPFRRVAFDPAWRTPTVVSLARGVYADRAFDRLPVLADALMDAGCTDADVLDHCRAPGPHARGCWVVDRVLGKE
jgi:hypothetical protein